MRKMQTMLLIFIIAVCTCTLSRYFSGLWPQWHAQERISWQSFEETSLWLYRDRGPGGQPASLYKVTTHFSPIDPMDGPNWEIRIPGWLPAGLSLVGLSWGVCALCGRKRHD